MLFLDSVTSSIHLLFCVLLYVCVFLLLFCNIFLISALISCTLHMIQTDIVCNRFVMDCSAMRCDFCVGWKRKTHVATWSLQSIKPLMSLSCRTTQKEDEKKHTHSLEKVIKQNWSEIFSFIPCSVIADETETECERKTPTDRNYTTFLAAIHTISTWLKRTEIINSRRLSLFVDAVGWLFAVYDFSFSSFDSLPVHIYLFKGQGAYTSDFAISVCVCMLFLPAKSIWCKIQSNTLSISVCFFFCFFFIFVRLDIGCESVYFFRHFPWLWWQNYQDWIKGCWMRCTQQDSIHWSVFE